jgi:hypothetical protein
MAIASADTCLSIGQDKILGDRWKADWPVLGTDMALATNMTAQRARGEPEESRFGSIQARIDTERQWSPRMLGYSKLELLQRFVHVDVRCCTVTIRVVCRVPKPQ